MTAVAVRQESRRQGSVFGLDVQGTLPIPHIVRAPAMPASRSVTVDRVAAREIAARWADGGKSSLVARRYPDGRPFMLIDRHQTHGFQIWAPRHGRYEVAADGTSVRAAVPRDPRWERLFFAQVLPLAAALQRIEVFHASAIALEGRAYAFVAPSGAGKTSLAAHLVARGAGFVTDDVLALDRGGDEIVAHAGSNVLCLASEEHAALGHSLGRIVGRSDKLHLAVDTVTNPLPLAGIFYLERRPEHRALHVERVAGEPHLVLASGFITYLSSSQFLLDHLELCAEIAKSVPMYRVNVPHDFGARRLADELEGSFL